MGIAARLRPAGVMLLAIMAALLGTVMLAAGGKAPGVPAESMPQNGTAAGGAGRPAAAGVIQAVAAENQYGSVVAQVGGAYVRVTSLLSNPNTDPHAFEVSAAAAQQVGQARLVVQNGLGYDSFINSIEAAVPNISRKIVDVQQLLKMPDTTPNPHLWYDPATMPKVAQTVANDLAAVEPAHAAYFQRNAQKFTSDLVAWQTALKKFADTHKHTAVASTEPVADYLLNAAHLRNLTPWSFQAAVMNGTDPSPQDVATEKALISQRKVSALVCNEQVSDPLTKALVTLANAHHVPVVGVYETMPASGYDYQSWMLAETSALTEAVEHS